MTARHEQHGIHCPYDDEDIYSNSRHDFTECRCGQFYIDGGFDYQRLGFPTGYDHSDLIYIKRRVDRDKLPSRYRVEVPE